MIFTRLTQIYRISNLQNIVFCFAAVVFERVRNNENGSKL